MNEKCRNKGCKEVFKHRMARDRHSNSKDCTFPRSAPKVKISSGYEKLETGGLRCRKCSVLLKNSTSIYKHSRSKCRKETSSSNEYKCTLCVKIFRYKSKLNEHMLRGHKYKMQCPTCEHAFQRTDHYKSHVKQCSFPSMADLPPHDEATEESEEVVTDFTNNDSLIANEVVLTEEFREKIKLEILGMT